MKGYITKEQLSDSLKNELSDFSSQLENKANKLINIDVTNFGFVGDGDYDDSIAINKAIKYANTLIQERQSGVDSFAGLTNILLPAKKIYIKSPIIINNAINLKGHGTSTTLVISNNIDYVIEYNKIDGISQTCNEEAQIEGGSIKDLRISDTRKYNINSAIYMYGVDHLTLENVYFYGVKGSCIQMKGVRECNFANIYTRFCGDVEKPLFEIVKNSGGDTSNLNIGNNLSVIFPFWSVLSFDEGNFVSINNFLIHGLFEEVVNSLQTYFNENTYLSNPFDFIELKNGASCSINNFEGVYCPQNKGYFNVINGSKLYLNNIIMNSHYKSIQTHDSLDYFIKASGSSKVYLNGSIEANMAYQSGNITICDDESFILGSLSDINAGAWLNSDISKMLVAQNIEVYGDINKSIKINGRSTQASEIDNEHAIRTMFDFTLPKDQNKKSILKLGCYQYGFDKPMISIPNNTLFRLPIMEDSYTPDLTGFMWISSNDGGKLKFKIDSHIKTVQTD